MKTLHLLLRIEATAEDDTGNPRRVVHIQVNSSEAIKPGDVEQELLAHGINTKLYEGLNRLVKSANVSADGKRHEIVLEDGKPPKLPKLASGQQSVPVPPAEEKPKAETAKVAKDVSKEKDKK